MTQGHRIEQLADGKVTLHCGDCLDLLKTLDANSIDACVTDPPYALVSIVKRFGGKNAAAVKVPSGGSGAYARASSGFMQKTWDTGKVAFNPEFWNELARVIKPGAYVVAFGGDRTFHRLFSAIEDGGLEPRHTIAWLFGSGFPKNHSIARHLKDTEWCDCDK